jgi:2-dehydropantoate 2-reductase
MADLRHAILGAGGIGGLIGTCLAHSGTPVTLIVRREAMAAYPRKVRLESAFGNFEAVVSIADEVPSVDVLWVTVKATQLEQALSTITHPSSVGAIVPLLNGIDHLARLRSRYGAENIIAATIAVEAERSAPGHFVERTPFCRLNMSSAGKNLLGGALDQFQKIGFECRFIEDEATLMWSKIVFLAPFALSTTAADKTVGEILANPSSRELGLSCIREACAVAIAEGAKVNADTVIAGALKMPGNMRSSMQKDVAQGNPPELDAIAGPILRGAARHGIAIPATRQLVAEVERRSGPSPV